MVSRFAGWARFVARATPELCHAAADFVRLLPLVFAAAFFGAATAASNVVDYTYDAAGNITQISRRPTGGFAITSFDPSSGPVGATVTIYGAGFSTTPANNVVKFNGTTATVSASDTGSISTTVPSGSSTGRITVTVGGNTATSATDFVVTVPGAPTIASFTPTTGASGASIAVAGTNFEIAAGATTVKLNGVTAAASVTSATALSFTVPTAAASGRVTATTSGGTGTSAQDFVVPPAGVAANEIVAVVRVTPGGPALNVALGTANTRALILFDGSANTFYSMQFGQLAVTPSTASVAYSVIKPDNTVLVTGTMAIATNNRPTIHFPKLPATGTYSVLVSPGIATFNSNVKVAADPTVTLDGSAASVALDTPGQSARVLFDASASQRIGLGVTGFALTPGNTGASAIKAYSPDGTQLGTGDVASCYAAAFGNPQGNCDGEMLTTAAGIHTLVVSPPNVTAASFGVQLSNEVTGALTVDSGADANLTRVGQDGRHTFSATAGDSLGFALSAIAPQPQAQSFQMNVLKPDGTSLVSGQVTPPAGGYLELGTLAATGTYVVTVDPSLGAHGTARLTVKQGPALSTASAPTAFAPATTTEATRFTFSGTAGQNLALGINSLAYVGSGSSDTPVKVYSPSRTLVVTGNTCNPAVASGRCKATLTNLPATGTYSVVLEAPAGVKITGNASISDDITGTLVAGTPQAILAQRDGQNARLTFAGTAGESTAIKVYGVSTTPSGQSVQVKVYRPDGALLTVANSSSSASAMLSFGSLPSTGTYTVLLDPVYGVTWQGTAALDPGTSMTVDGATASLATSAAGEPLRFRFSGTTGQRLELGIGGLTYGASNSNGTTMTLYRPDGSSVTSASCYTTGSGSCEAGSTSLPSTGVYAVTLVPPVASAITGGTFAISTPVSGTFTIGDPAQTVAVTRPGQTVRYTFSGTAAQLLRLNWSTTTVATGSTVSVSVLKPDGSTLSSSSFGNGASGGLDIASLPSTGTYTVVLDPSLGATMSASMSLVTR